MLSATVSTISRMFGASTSSLNTDRTRIHGDERDPLAGSSTEAGRSSEEANGHVSRRPSLDGHWHSDSTPLLTRKQSSRFSSSVSTTVAPEVHYPGPPHVLWKAPHHPYSHLQRQNGQDSPTKSVSGMSMVITTPTTAGWGAQPMSRSASSPSLLLTPLSNAPASHRDHRPSSSLGRRSSRSIKLATDSMYISEDSDVEVESDRSLRNGAAGHLLPKQLSPIHEQQVPFPPHRKLSLDSVPRTPDSTRTFDRINGHNAFINRPLKRSLSQTSTSTHKSNISAVPPVIPPLDLRPSFQNAMGVQGAQGRMSPTCAQPPVPRKSRLAPPSLPTVIGSPRQTNKVSVIYEDGASYGGPASARTSSFITAPSISLNTPTAEPGQRFSFGNELGPNVYLDPSSFASDSARGESMTTDADDTPQATHPAQRLPAGLYDDAYLGADEFGQMHTRPNSRASLRPGNPTPSSTHSRSRNSSLLTAPRTSALRTRSVSPADESFLDQRWLKGLSFGSQRFVFPPSSGEQRERRFSCAFILFCVGFIMPWCWLIGGWLLTSDGEVQEEERGFVLPLWHKRQPPPLVKAEEKRKADTGVPASGTAADKNTGEKRAKTSSWYPLLAPSLESLTPPHKEAVSTRRLKRCLPSTRRADPWITRCRAAAAVSGVMLLAACIVAIIFAAGVHR